MEWSGNFVYSQKWMDGWSKFLIGKKEWIEDYQFIRSFILLFHVYLFVHLFIEWINTSDR